MSYMTQYVGNTEKAKQNNEVKYSSQVMKLTYSLLAYSIMNITWMFPISKLYTKKSWLSHSDINWT